MSAPRYIFIDGKPHAWREILRIRREQTRAQRQSQPTLFELKEDRRPETQRKAADRFQQPPLFQ
jgi:hypothetical protein